MTSQLLHRALIAIQHQWTWWWEANNIRDEFSRAIISILLAILLITWYLWTFVNLKQRTLHLPPGPRGLPILGYLPFLGTDLHKTFAKLSQSYGPIFKLWLGNKLCIVLSSPLLAKEVVRDKDTYFANRDATIGALVLTYGGIDISFSPNGAHWRNMRKLFVREVLSTSNLEACYALRKDELRKTIRHIHNNIGRAMDIGEITFVTELNIVMNMLWGRTLGGRSGVVGAEFREMASRIVEMIGKSNVSDYLPLLSRFDLQGVERESRRLLAKVEEIFDSVIEEGLKMKGTKANHGDHEAMNMGKKDFLQILLEMKDQKDNSATPMTLTLIKVMFTDIVIGGTETTATLVEWVMAEIMNNPEIMKRTQEELDFVVGTNNIVEESHLPNLRYLDVVVKETFRLHPPLPLLIPRCPSQTSTIGDYTIPKGTAVFLNVWSMQRDPEVWDDPDVFKPERFLCDGTNKCDYSGNNFNFLPFGSGRRICAGLPLAEKMVMYVLATLLHSFEWELPNGEDFDLTEKFGLVMKKKTPLRAIPSQRLSTMDLYM